MDFINIRIENININKKKKKRNLAKNDNPLTLSDIYALFKKK